MISDIATILWKEMKEFILGGPSLRGGKWGMLIFLGVFGILMPLQSGRAWLDSPATLLVWGWVPFLLVNSVVADAIAGERERHTLETLLASRLSDRAILLGKVAAAVAYGWGLTLGTLVVAVVTINLAHGGGQFLFFPPTIFAGILALSFLVSLLAAGLGVLVSLRAATVRQAQQTLSVVFLLLFVPLFLLPMLPTEVQARLAQAVQGADVNLLVLVAGAVLVLLDAGLLGLALARFKRSRLILD